MLCFSPLLISFQFHFNSISNTYLKVTSFTAYMFSVLLVIHSLLWSSHWRFYSHKFPHSTPYIKGLVITAVVVNTVLIHTDTVENIIRSNHHLKITPFPYIYLDDGSGGISHVHLLNVKGQLNVVVTIATHYTISSANLLNGRSSGVIKHILHLLHHGGVGDHNRVVLNHHSRDNEREEEEALGITGTPNQTIPGP